MAEIYLDKILKVENDYSWLELSEIPDNVYNPFTDGILNRSENPAEDLIKTLMMPDYIHMAAKLLLNIDLPPYQCIILDMLWTKKSPMLIATRGGSKSFLLAVYILLRMIFHPRCSIVVAGAGLRHSRQIHEYMTRIWENSDILRDIAGKSRTAGPRREIDRFQFEIGDSNTHCIPLGTGEKIRGLRANYVIADEFSMIQEEIFNIVVRGFAAVSPDPIDRIKEAAMVKQLKKKGLWTKEMERLNKDRFSGNQIVFSGTAYFSFNHFYKYFKRFYEIIKSKGNKEKLRDVFGDDDVIQEGMNWKDYAIIRLPYTHIPEGLLDQAMLAQSKVTLTPAQFHMEYSCCFSSDSDGFYKRSIIENATTNKPVQLLSGEKVQFSALKYGNKERVYTMGVDPAADADNAAIIVVEMHENHRRIVYCWTTNKGKYTEFKKNMKSQGTVIGDDYYRYIARKIRSLMRSFNIEHIMMDKNGGGTAIAEALESKDTYETDEFPIYQIIDIDNPKSTDQEEGLHILELVVPTQDFNSEANHGMLKDFQDKILLFPMFDSIELAKYAEIDHMNEIQFDTYEDLLFEIEDLKSEITSIVVTPSSILGKEVFDTPQIKSSGDKKGRLRKDRFSALLYANYYIRNKGKNDPFIVKYKPVGGSKDYFKKAEKNTSLYTGIGIVKNSSSNDWLSGKTTAVIRRK